MASGIMGLFKGQAKSAPLRLDWEDEQLVFVVREPFVSKTSQANIVASLITPETELGLESHTPENGVIFSDGVEADSVSFNSGATVPVHLAARKTTLVVPAQ